MSKIALLIEPPSETETVPVETSTPSAQPDGAAELHGAAKRHRVRKVISRVLDGMLWLVMGAIVLMVLGGSLGWWQVETVLSGSMRPGIQPGDMEVLRAEPISAVRVGQILAIRPPKMDATITHRVIAVTHKSGATFVRTKGDANDVADPWGSIQLTGAKAWKVDAVVPKLGYLSEWAKGRSLRLILLVGMVGLTAVSLLARIWRRTS
jgi:signal peptidase I